MPAQDLTPYRNNNIITLSGDLIILHNEIRYIGQSWLLAFDIKIDLFAPIGKDFGI